jgi:hypothetical protein
VPSSPGNPSVFPSAIARAPGLGELGPLRNGLGSIQNLELLLGSIRVGQKELFAAVSAVHADCASMNAHLGRLTAALVERGTEEACAHQLMDTVWRSVSALETALAPSVRLGRLSAARRLGLEQDLARASRELGAALPLVALLDRAAQPQPVEPAQARWVHASSVEERAPAIRAWFTAAPELLASGLAVDLAAAQLLLVLAAALVAQGAPASSELSIEFRRPPGATPETWVSLDPGGTASVRSGSGLPVQIAKLPIIEPSLFCAQVAARRLGGSFEYTARAHRVCICWPLS